MNPLVRVVGVGFAVIQPQGATTVLSRTTLRQRILLLAVIVAVGLLTVGVVGPLAIRERDVAAADMRSRIEPMRQAVGNLQLAMIDQESALRGFVLTGEEPALDPFYDGRRAALSQLLRLQSLSRQDPALNSEVERVQDVVDHWEEGVADHMIALVRAGRVDEAVAFERSGVASATFQEVREALSELRQLMLREASAADERVLAARGRLTALVWALGVVGLSLTVLTGLMLRNWITVPLRQITAAVEAVTRGDRHRPIPSVGPPELASLAANVEEMRAETVQRLEEAVRARQALEQQGPAVVTLRAELAPSDPQLPPATGFAAAFQPAQGDLAGDWYDLVDLGEDRVALLMVDVSGHGPDAGVFALRAKHLLGAVMVERPDPGQALTWLAERIGHTGERFLTGLVIEVDARTRRVRYANAGHPPALLVEPGGERIRRLGPTGPLLGPLPGSWETAELTVPPGAQLLAYTDGVVEARDAAGECFGDDRLARILTAGPGEPSAIIDACVEQVRAFSGGRLGDDVTVAVLALETSRDRAVA